MLDPLVADGFHVVINDGENEAVLSDLYKVMPDIVIISDNSPIGRQLCSQIRKALPVPIIAVYNKVNEISRAAMLEVGADTCLSETVGKMELVARAHSLLRRYGKLHRENPHFNSETSQVYIDDRIIKLAPIEFRLLSSLAHSKGKVVPYGQLIAEVWDEDISLDTLHHYVGRLSHDLGIKPDSSYRLQSCREEGYCFCKKS